MMKRKSPPPPPPSGAPPASPAGAPDAKKRKRATQPVGNLTNAQKRLLCVQFARAKMTQQELCHWAKREFRLANLPHQSTISKILARAPELTSMPARALPARRRGLVTHPELDVALSNWVLFARHRRLKLSGDSIKEQARRLAARLGLASTMTFSNGWLGGFKKRHNIRLGGGTSSTTPPPTAADATTAALPAASSSSTATVGDLQQLAALYRPQDVFTMAETGLLYALSPEKPAGRAGAAAKSPAASSGPRPRLTVVLCVNADASERLEPMFIGPAPLPGTDAGGTAALPLNESSDPEAVGFHYQDNGGAWMTPVLFQDWVEALDTRMRDVDRHVLLLVARSAPTHICAGLALSHVRLELLPPSVERPVGPLEAGVIAAFKRRYRRYHMCHALDLHEAGRARVFAVEQAQAMRWTRYCWRDLPDEVIRHYWQRSGLLPPAAAATSADTTATGSVEGAEEEIDREICDTVSALDVLRPLMIDEFISPADEDAGIHCPGADDLDLVRTVPTSMLGGTSAAGDAAGGSSGGTATSTEMTPRLQELHNRSMRRPTPVPTAATTTTSAAPTPSPATTSSVPTTAPPPTADAAGSADGSATDEQLLACFRVLLPELDRLRFDDRTKKSIRTTFRRLKEAVEQPHAQLYRGRGGPSVHTGGRNAPPVVPAVGQGGHVVYHPTQEPQHALQLPPQPVMGFHPMAMGMPAMGMPAMGVPYPGPPPADGTGGGGAPNGPGTTENAVI